MCYIMGYTQISGGGRDNLAKELGLGFGGLKHLRLSHHLINELSF